MRGAGPESAGRRRGGRGKIGGLWAGKETGGCRGEGVGRSREQEQRGWVAGKGRVQGRGVGWGEELEGLRVGKGAGESREVAGRGVEEQKAEWWRLGKEQREGEGRAEEVGSPAAPPPSRRSPRLWANGGVGWGGTRRGRGGQGTGLGKWVAGH